MSAGQIATGGFRANALLTIMPYEFTNPTFWVPDGPSPFCSTPPIQPTLKAALGRLFFWPLSGCRVPR
jgi:hypothetical protein